MEVFLNHIVQHTLIPKKIDETNFEIVSKTFFYFFSSNILFFHPIIIIFANIITTNNIE